MTSDDICYILYLEAYTKCCLLVWWLCWV